MTMKKRKIKRKMSKSMMSQKMNPMKRFASRASFAMVCPFSHVEGFWDVRRFVFCFLFLLLQDHHRGRSPARDRDRDRRYDSHRYRYTFLTYCSLNGLLLPHFLFGMIFVYLLLSYFQMCCRIRSDMHLLHLSLSWLEDHNMSITRVLVY